MQTLATPDLTPALMRSPRLPFCIDVLPLGRPSDSFLRSARSHGLQVGPCVNTRTSEHFDLTSPDFQVWLHSVLKAGRVRSLLLLPFTSCQFGRGRVFRSAASRALAKAFVVCFRLGADLAVPCLLLVPRGLPICLSRAWALLCDRPGITLP